MQSLEYNGPYSRRYTCGDCLHRKGNITDYYAICEENGIEIHRNNNVCRAFKSRIKNPSSPEFNFDEYLEFLGSDFYRPYGITDEIVGYIDRPSFYIHDKRPKIPVYKTIDKPYCRLFMPRAHVKVGMHKFEIDYRLYREKKFVKDGEIHFDLHLWTDRPTQRKYNQETYGRWRLTSDQ